MFSLILLFALTHITLGNDMTEGKCVATWFSSSYKTTTCSPKFKWADRDYQSCTNVDSDEFWCLSPNMFGIQQSYKCSQNFNGCTPEIKGNKWYCSIFPYIDKLEIDMGERGFCGKELRSFPECDPQLPPTVTFYTQGEELGPIDMKKELGGYDPDNDMVMKRVLAQARNPNSMIVYIVHGYRNNGEDGWQEEIMNGLFKKYGSRGYNVIVGIVSWKWGAMSHFKEGTKNSINQLNGKPWTLGQYCTSEVPVLSYYRKAAANTMVIGRHLAVLNNWFRFNIEQGYYYPFQTHCIGHSLGAQTCGFFGKSYFEITGKKLTSIVGLDPAGPIFEENDQKKQKLYKDDADFVQVIHTNTEQLGHKETMGHIDYYLNGGAKQPADICGTIGQYKDSITGSCSHHYAYWFLAKMYNYPTLTCELIPYNRRYAIGDLLGTKADLGIITNLKAYSKTSKAVTNEKRPTEYVNTLQC